MHDPLQPSLAPPLTVEEVQEWVQIALRQWHNDPGALSPLASLHLYRQLRQAELISEHEATNRVLYQALQVLEERYPKEAMLLRRSELDNELNDFVANALNVAPSTLFRYKKSAIIHLAEALLELETETRDAHRTRMLARLAPPSYSHLLGVEGQLQQLTELMTAEGAPWIVALAGMGGIGKTTLADAVVRSLIMQGSSLEIGWVTARQVNLQWNGPLQEVTEPALTLESLSEELCTQLLDERMKPGPGGQQNLATLLRGVLKARPHLVVIDNLETVIDIEALVSALRDLVAPSKFLLTSRESLFTQPDIYHVAVPELSAADALALIRQEAQGRNLPLLQQATDADLLPIYEIAGGNPLALRLIAGQTYIHPLPVVLENLAKARGTQIENLYTYIYHQAWQRLDETSRRVLLAMPLAIPTGAELAHLVEISEMDEARVVRALETLVKLNLVDVRGDLYQRRYTIHNLTRTFLHEQVLHWQ
jgi:hypothetical protein